MIPMVKTSKCPTSGTDSESDDVTDDVIIVTIKTTISPPPCNGIATTTGIVM